MEFLKKEKRFDFLYGGKPFAELEYEVSQTKAENVLTTTYFFKDGFKITNIAKKYGTAYEWVSWFENTGEKDTEIISELWDCCILLPLAHEEPLRWTAYQPEFEERTIIYAPAGSTWRYDEFCAFPDRRFPCVFPTGHITASTKAPSPTDKQTDSSHFCVAV